MERTLNNGQQQNALELVQLAPVGLEALLHPFLGGQWQNNIPTLRIPYYRPLEPLCPGLLPGCAEQHLAGQIYAGLTRFDESDDMSIGGLAYHWQVSSDGLRRHFYIRSTLCWHDGDTTQTTQLRQWLRLPLELSVPRIPFASISHIDVTHAQCLTITLHRSDYWLPFRLTNYCSVLAHPDDPAIGYGPFRLKRFSPGPIRLENHPQYHLQHPLVQTMEYWITLQLFDRDLSTSYRHPVQITIGDRGEFHNLHQASNRINLGFCYLALHHGPRFNKTQAQRLVLMVHHSSLPETLSLEEDLIIPSHEVLPG